VIPAERPVGSSAAGGRDGTASALFMTSGVFHAVLDARGHIACTRSLHALPSPLAARLPHPIGA
jgi:hypothetical protein